MVVDAWVNIFPEGFGAAWSAEPENAGVGALFGEDLARGRTVDELLGAMDEAGVETGVLTAGLGDPDRMHQAGMYTAEDFLAIADEHPGRFLVSVTVDRATKPVQNCRRLRDLAQHDHVVLARVTPLVEQYELNHRLYYPVYATCAELGLPVVVNVGIPGPQVRSRCQDPVLLQDLLIDFPELTVIGAHMGHPYEALLIQYMLKWPQLHLMTSAYLATYMDPRWCGSWTRPAAVDACGSPPTTPSCRSVERSPRRGSCRCPRRPWRCSSATPRGVLDRRGGSPTG